MNILQRLFSNNSKTEYETVEVEKEDTAQRTYYTEDYKIELTNRNVKLYGGQIRKRENGIVFEQPHPRGYYHSSNGGKCRIDLNYRLHYFFTYDSLVSYHVLDRHEQEFKDTVTYTIEEQQPINEKESDNE